MAEFRQANQQLALFAQRQLSDFWRSLNLSGDPVKVRNALLDFYPDLVTSFGDTAAVLGADFYDALRDVPASAKSFKAAIAEPAPIVQAQGAVRWAVGPLWDGNPSSAFDQLAGATQRLVLQPGRDSIFTSAKRDPVRTLWARVPSGSDTCEFCIMLASRGADYGSAKSAGEGREFHDNCHCVVVPVRSKADYPEDYDPKVYMKLWTDGPDSSK